MAGSSDQGDDGDAGSDSDGFDYAGLEFDPADHTVSEVEEFVEANPDAAEAILELELNGKNRSTLIEALEELAG